LHLVSMVLSANHLRKSAILIFVPLREFVADKLTGRESHMN
jgi:hypothetical protein